MSDKKTVMPQRTVLIFQGGGALGAFQAGVFEATQRGELSPDWVIGTSIGAINAALIAGNRPEHRMERLYEFWARVSQGWMIDQGASADAASFAGALTGHWNALTTMMAGLPNFFTPRWASGFAFGLAVAPGSASYYDPMPLRKTLEELVDFDYLNDSPIRLSVGAVDVESGQIRYFDTRSETLKVEHILASSALPPAFPAVEIDGRHYWDGGIHSNTPLEWMLRDAPRKHSLCFMATLWPIQDSLPQTLPSVLKRGKELQYASRAQTLVGMEQELHSLRHSVSLLAARLPKAVRDEAEVARSISLGCRSVYHLIRLQAPRLPDENHAKDIEFTPARVGQRWAAGYQDALRALDARPWEQAVGADEGVLLHDFTNIRSRTEAVSS